MIWRLALFQLPTSQRSNAYSYRFCKFRLCQLMLLSIISYFVIIIIVTIEWRNKLTTEF